MKKNVNRALIFILFFANGLVFSAQNSGNVRKLEMRPPKIEQTKDGFYYIFKIKKIKNIPKDSVLFKVYEITDTPYSKDTNNLSGIGKISAYDSTYDLYCDSAKNYFVKNRKNNNYYETKVYPITNIPGDLTKVDSFVTVGKDYLVMLTTKDGKIYSDLFHIKPKFNGIIIENLNYFREYFLEPFSKKYWLTTTWQLVMFVIYICYLIKNKYEVAKLKVVPFLPFAYILFYPCLIIKAPNIWFLIIGFIIIGISIFTKIFSCVIKLIKIIPICKKIFSCINKLKERITDKLKKICDTIKSVCNEAQKDSMAGEGSSNDVKLRKSSAKDSFGLLSNIMPMFGFAGTILGLILYYANKENGYSLDSLGLALYTTLAGLILGGVSLYIDFKLTKK